MKSTVFGYCVKATWIVSLILVQMIFFVHSEEKEAKTHSLSKMELVMKEQLSYRVCSYLLQLLCLEPTCLCNFHKCIDEPQGSKNSQGNACMS